MFNIKEEVIAAEKRIYPYVRETPLEFSLPIAKQTGVNLFLKCENLQYTGAFKVRGAFNALLSLTDAEKKQGVVTASSGNHGAAVAFALSTLKIPGKIFVPLNASATKIDNIKNYSVPLEQFGNDCVLTELHAIEYAKKNGMIYVSPYNNLQVIAGQGTIGVELLRQLSKIDVILVPIGGGGLISGIAGYIKKVSPTTKVIGVMPANSPVMFESIKAGHIVEMETLPTLSDATAGGIEPGSITFEICQEFVDDYLLVSEDEIKEAIRTLIKTQHLLTEGAASIALAALLTHADRFTGKNVVVLLSGANIAIETLKRILE